MMEWSQMLKILIRSALGNKVNNFNVTILIHETFGELIDLFICHLISQTSQRSGKCRNMDFSLAIIIENLKKKQ